MTREYWVNVYKIGIGDYKYRTKENCDKANAITNYVCKLHNVRNNLLYRFHVRLK